MRVLEVGRDSAGGNCRLTAIVERARGERIELWFSYPESAAHLMTSSVDPFVPVLLPVCAFEHEPLVIHSPVSPRLAHTLREIRSLLTQWHPAAGDFEIDVRSAAEPPRSGERTACFVSGGVDSSYSITKALRDPRPHLPPLRYLLYMRGLETVLERARGTDEVEVSLRRLAEERGLELLVGSANFRSHFHLDWLRQYVGAGLAAVALSLSHGLRVVLLPASDSYAPTTTPLGTHPLLDPLWSTEATQILHDGCESDRVEKIEYLAEHAPDLVARLRVCLANDGGPENCGRCTKCIRTILTLRVLDRSDLLQSLPSEPPAGWEHLLVTTAIRPVRVRILEEIRDLARAKGAPESLQRALDRVVEGAARRVARLQRYEAWKARPGWSWVENARNLRGSLRRTALRLVRRRSRD